MPQWVGKWKGGRIYVDRDERRRYVIEKMRNGRRYTIPLAADCTDPELSLLLFTRDPEGFKLRHAEQTPEGEVVLTVDEIAAFEKAMRQSAKMLSEPHIRAVVAYLNVWCEDLKGRDIRRTPVDVFRQLRDGHDTAQNYRTVALKAYCSWLVKRQRLKLGENPVALLEQVRAKPKRLGGDVVYSKEQIEAFYAILKPQRVRDVFLLVAKTGLHGSEAARIAGSDCKLYELPDKASGIAAVATVRHKSKRDHRQSLDAQALAAVRRLQVAGGAPCKERIHEAIVAAARKANCPPVFLRYLRHSFITLANESGREVRMTEGGVPLGVIAAAVGHRSMLMAKDHYLGSKVPPMITVPLDLSHPEDPVAISSGRSARTA